MAAEETPQIEVLTTLQNPEVDKTQGLINELLDAVARHPAAAAQVLRAAGAVIADNEAYMELGFDQATEDQAERDLAPSDRLRGANSDQERGRIISSNILDRAAIYANRLADAVQLEEAANPNADLPQSA